MVATIDEITKLFRKYNAAIFNNELPLPQFQLLKSFRICGRFSCKKPIGKRRLKGQRIEISCYYEWQEEELVNVLLHEMLHYYLAFKHLDNNITHGELFIDYAKTINEKYNCRITEKIDCSKFKRTKNAPWLSWALAHMFG